MQLCNYKPDACVSILKRAEYFFKSFKLDEELGLSANMDRFAQDFVLISLHLTK